ncbi:serine/threonine-protein kinase [Pseudonocardia sp. RS010]|uniref:serine/threonine-protein kinase n=1 Tax=Pseudonocardia sp. RS010 TaxID=3385979 RepID=UPI00399FD392
MSTQEDEQPGRVVGDRYRLSAQLGSGAMGTVWSGFDEVLRRRVAVKELKLPRGVPEREALGMRERMLREARALGGLSHPNVITVFDVVDAAGEPLVVLEMVPSRNLATIISEQGRLNQRQAAVVGYATAAALRAAHRAGITHRDVKPGNVLVAHDGRIKLTDFGIARNASDAPMTTAGLVLGSPAYIAPEVAMGAAVTPAADLWGLGATLFAALEGRPPYDVKGDPVSTITEVVDGEVPRPREYGPVAEVVAALMVKDPEARMPLDEVRRRLRPLLDDPDDPLYPGSPDAPTAFSGIARPEAVPEPRVAASGPLRASEPWVGTYGPAGSTRLPAAEPGPPAPRGLAAAPGPLPTPTGAHAPVRPDAQPAAAPRGRAASNLPARWALPLAVAGALLVLLGAAGGYGLVRSLAGQSPASTVTVTTDRSPTTVHTDAAGWSMAVPANWARYQEGGPGPVVRFVSADGSEALAVWKAGSEDEITAGLTATHLGVDAVEAGPAEPVAGTPAGVREQHYTTTRGAQERTTVLRTVPAADGLWALALTVPVERAGDRSAALFTALAATFTTPAPE